MKLSEMTPREQAEYIAEYGCLVFPDCDVCFFYDGEYDCCKYIPRGGEGAARAWLADHLEEEEACQE